MATLWRIAPDTKNYVADDMTGGGAKATGGRWNLKGTPVVYCSSSIALAMLETFAHYNAAQLPMNRFLVRIDVPDAVWASADNSVWDNLPVGWNAIPDSKTSHDIGEKRLAECKAPLLLVPSVIVEEEANVLINPAHPAAANISARKVRACYYHALKRPKATKQSA